MDAKTVKVIKIALTILAAAIAAALGFCSCGITRASIVQPKDGSVTSITITTNNPISTNVTPSVNTGDILPNR